MNTTRRIDLQHGHGWPVYLMLILLHGFTFAALGPLVGAFVSPGVIFLPIAVIAAYWISAPAALVAGLSVGAIAPFVLGRMLYLPAAAIGAASGSLIPFAFMHSPAPLSLLAVYGFSGAVAALVCTRATRSIRLRRLAA